MRRNLSHRSVALRALAAATAAAPKPASALQDCPHDIIDQDQACAMRSFAGNLRVIGLQERFNKCVD
jgi:hypothetical protein